MKCFKWSQLDLRKRISNLDGFMNESTDTRKKTIIRNWQNGMLENEAN